MMYAKIEGGQIVKRKDLDPSFVLDPAEAQALGKPYWLPIVEEFEDLSTGPMKAKDVIGPEIQADRVYRKVTVRDMTQAELDARAEQQKVDAEEKLDVHPAFKALAVALFETVNDVRQLKGQQPVTAQQFKAFLRSKM